MTAANSQRGHLGIEVEGKQWVFAFTTNALCALEEALNLKQISELDDYMRENLNFRTVRTLFRVGLTDCHPDMTDREAGELMDAIGGLQDSFELVGKALANAFPEAAKGGAANPRKPAPKAPSDRGTGRTSTAPGAKAKA